MKSVLRGLPIVAVSLFAATGSFATTESLIHTHPGSMCQSSTTLYYNGVGGIENPNASASWTLCPMVKPGWGVMNWASARVNDRNSLTEFACTVWAADQEGDWGYYSTQYSGGTGWQTLNFSGFSDPGNTGINYMLCSIPAVSSGNKSVIASYRAQQQWSYYP